MVVNSRGLIVISVSCQGLMHLEEIELHLERPDLLWGVLLAAFLGTSLC